MPPKPPGSVLPTTSSIAMPGLTYSSCSGARRGGPMPKPFSWLIRRVQKPKSMTVPTVSASIVM